jgi:hypothetical protein
MLFAPRTYDVAPAGGDANSGLSASEAFARCRRRRTQHSRSTPPVRR